MPGSDLRLPHHLVVITELFLNLSLLIGLLANPIVIFIISKSASLRRQPINGLVASLCVADIAELVHASAMVYSLIPTYRGFPITVCKLQFFFHVLSNSVQLLTLVAISYERLQAVANPFQLVHQRKRRVLISIVLSWIIGIAMGLFCSLTLPGGSVAYDLCIGKHSTEGQFLYSPGIISLPLGGLAITLVIACYGRMVILLYRHSIKTGKRRPNISKKNSFGIRRVFPKIKDPGCFLPKALCLGPQSTSVINPYPEAKQISNSQPSNVKTVIDMKKDGIVASINLPGLTEPVKVPIRDPITQHQKKCVTFKIQPMNSENKTDNEILTAQDISKLSDSIVFSLNSENERKNALESPIEMENICKSAVDDLTEDELVVNSVNDTTNVNTETLLAQKELQFTSQAEEIGETERLKTSLQDFLNSDLVGETNNGTTDAELAKSETEIFKVASSDEDQKVATIQPLLSQMKEENTVKIDMAYEDTTHLPEKLLPTDNSGMLLPNDSLSIPNVLPITEKEPSVIEVVDMLGDVTLKPKEENQFGPMCVMDSRAREQGKRQVEARTAKRASLIILIFLLLWLPQPLVEVVLPGRCDAHAVTVAVATLTSALNPIIYGLAIRQFRAALINIIKRHWKRK